MPLFACSKCNAVENTALGEYWSRIKDPLCSECSSLCGGKWHGRFPKERADNGKWVPDPKQPHFLDHAE